MTGKQSGVLWLGLLLVVVRLFTTNQWSELWSSVGVARKTTTSSSANSSAPQLDAQVIQQGPYGTEPL